MGHSNGFKGRVLDFSRGRWHGGDAADRGAPKAASGRPAVLEGHVAQKSTDFEKKRARSWKLELKIEDLENIFGCDVFFYYLF